jgi:RecQ family ATP-dependent DNA helicase
MIDHESQEFDSFFQQRVDFALETPAGPKIAFEVDGSHHQDSSQRVKDNRRDQALKGAGWWVERVRAADVGNVWEPSSTVTQLISNDKYIEAFNTVSSRFQSEPYAEEADLLIALPHAIARTQLAVILAMMDGSLRFEIPVWKLAVWKRDVAWTELAVGDLLEQVRHLCGIYGITFETTIELSVIRDHDESDVWGPSSREYQNAPYDSVKVFQFTSNEALAVCRDRHLFVDLSLDSRAGDDFGTIALETSIESTVPRIIIVRSAYRRAPEQFKPWPSARAVGHSEGLELNLEYFLRHLFRKAAFRNGQLEIIERAMSRKSAIGLLPTGSGKSLTFQMPALLSPGIAVVVVPLRSLMDDQVDNLNRAGITRVERIHSGLQRHVTTEAVERLRAGEIRLLYVAPERFQSVRFRRAMQASPIARDVSFIVIDEAHCVSEWGHDFRPAYLNLGRVAREVCVSGEDVPPLLALTATASMLVLTDIQRELDIGDQEENAVVATDNFFREELKYLPIHTTTSNKRVKLMDALQSIATAFGIDSDELLTDPSYGGIVFCRHVNGEFGVESIAQSLRQEYSLDLDCVKIFSGAKPRESAYVTGPDEWEKYKANVQRAFKSDKFPLLVATHGFGMGIDKQNIRYTIHYGIPGSIEALAQESGRAGRDKQTSFCAVVFTDQETAPEKDCLDQSISAEEANERCGSVPRQVQGDLSRLMFFHAGSFKGSDHDKAQSISLLDQLAERWLEAGVGPGERSDIQVSRPPIGSEGNKATDLEKSIYRLSLLGIVSDYTTDWQTRFDVRTVHLAPEVVEENLKNYIGRYRARERGESIITQAKSHADSSRPYDHLIGALCDWIYEEIEKGRRRSMSNLIQALRRCKSDGLALAQEIDQHLSRNIFTGRIAELAKHINPQEWWEIVRDIQTPAMASQMLGSCRRTLESIPDHPGLIFLEAVGSLWGIEPDIGMVAGRIRLGLQNYENSYGATRDEALKLADGLIEEIKSGFPDLFDKVVERLVAGEKSELIAIAAYPRVSDPQLKRLCAVPWIRGMTETSRSIRLQHVGSIA